MSREHIDDDSLDRYALDQATGAEENQIEEHLLVCRECQDRLALTDAFIRAMRAALKSRH